MVSYVIGSNVSLLQPDLCGNGLSTQNTGSLIPTVCLIFEECSESNFFSPTREITASGEQVDEFFAVPELSCVF